MNFPPMHFAKSTVYVTLPPHGAGLPDGSVVPNMVLTLDVAIPADATPEQLDAVLRPALHKALSSIGAQLDAQ